MVMFPQLNSVDAWFLVNFLLKNGKTQSNSLLCTVQINESLVNTLSIHVSTINTIIRNETIIWTGIRYTKILCYMRNSACRWCIAKNDKIFWSHLNYLKFWILIYLCKQVFMNYPIEFLDWGNKTKFVLASFSCFFKLLWGKKMKV